jgi:Predicted membrane protein
MSMGSIGKPDVPYASAPDGWQGPSGAQAPRVWRVGSISMGVTLMLIGTALAVSLWQDANAYELLPWAAPVVFILLGGELLVHLKLSGRPGVIVRYDGVSLFFVSVIGIGSLAAAALLSTGLLDELRNEWHAVNRTAFVKMEPVPVAEGLNRIVVQSASGVAVDAQDTDEIGLTGQIRYRSKEPFGSLDGMIRTHTSGTTLYIFVGTPDRQDGSRSADVVRTGLILTVPYNIEVEQRGL